MIDATRMKNLVLVVLLLSNACFGTNTITCSWGAWSQWNCNCCGNSIDKPVYRVRTQCCSGTFACRNLRVMAITITSIGADFLGKGKCLNDCTETDFKKHTSRCSSVEPTKNQTLLLATPDLCGSVCIGSLSTKVPSLPSSPQPSKATNRDMTRVTAASVKSSTNVPPYSSNNTVPAKDDTERPSPGSGRSLSTKVPSLPSSLQPSKATNRDMTRVTAAGVKSSTNVPPYTSTETVSAKNQTGPPDIGNGQSLAMSSRLVLWIAVILTTVSCLLDLTPI